MFVSAVHTFPLSRTIFSLTAADSTHTNFFHASPMFSVSCGFHTTVSVHPMRFRCSSVRFPEQPRNAKALDGNSPQLGRTYEGNFAPMVIVGDVNADGLGLTSWWQQETE